MTRARGGWPPSGFGVALRREREAAGLTAAALAKRVGVSKFTISRLEGGLHDPSWPLAIALAAALGVSLQAFLVTGEEPPRRQRGRPRKGNPPPNA